MRTFKWTVISLLILTLVSVFHYALPRSEVVRVVGVTQRLETLGWNSFFFSPIPAGQEEADARDIRLIETMRPGRDELVLRNEDTGWVWPPYFKFNSADVQARGRDLISSAEEPVWVAVTYYGWRSLILSTYPNVLRISPVDGPDVRLIPWTRIIFVILALTAATWLWLKLRRRRDATRDLRDDAVIAQGLGHEPGLREGRFGRFWQRLTGH